ncbi:hypothetical protein J437_LFUL002124 [Ladona fulva]|uniref:Probable ATP-dependent RNA helicase spindle-E n=1 Tax=Ladona fulva TaxID=123851 RepID=A0A8K0NUI1_LADFU|nr:hypothetical protein J437_LFUL002124 [Ladona fulva]
MDLLDFFDLSRKLEKVTIPGGISQTRKKVPPPPPVEESESEDEKDYAKEYQLKEEEELKKANFPQNQFSTNAGCQNTSVNMNDVEDVTLSSSFPNMSDALSDDIHEKYSFECNNTPELPIREYKDKIVSMIETNPVTVIQGFTGCGKTTQVPQYILDDYVNRRIHCNIIVTQPRRLAAISIADRVCKERGWDMGSLVGYQVGFNNATSVDTRLTYCTTGILLQKLIHKRDMNDYTHVILDEVHERDQDMDFVMLVVRKLLRTNSRTVRVVLMSATFEVERFSRYFSMPVGNNLEPAPVITVEQERKFKVVEMFISELGDLGSIPDTKVDEPGISTQSFDIAMRLIKIFDLIEEKKFEASKPSPDVKRSLAFKGSVLVFLPGINEIETFYKILQDEQESGHNLKGKRCDWWILPLHSSITAEEQINVFKLASPGQRKIILSTNIAESSITVKDIKFVIDFCLTKQLVVDSQTNFSSLQTTWASKTNCIQRSGRVGRVCDGYVYKMVTKNFYFKCMPEENTPEILRCPLDRLVLQAKLLDMGEPKAILALSLDPPDLTHLKNTVLKLKEVGALLMTTNGKVVPNDGDITYMGRVMARLPVDIHISKLIVLGHVFNVLNECVIMGAAMSTKSVFSTPFQERLKAYVSKLTWANSSCSDCVAFLNAYKLWRTSKMNGFFNRMAGDNERGWARRNFIQLKQMLEVDALVKDLTFRLRKMGIEEPIGDNHSVVAPQEPQGTSLFNAPHVVIAGAFYPNYFVRGAQGGQVNERDAVKMLLGRDPFTTVFLQGMPANQPGELYVKPIRDAFKECADDLKISFEASSKVYIQFPRPQMIERRPDREYVANIPGKVAMSVYKAIKLRQLKIPIQINLLPIANKRAEELGLSKSLFDKPGYSFLHEPQGVDRQVPLPCIDENIISLQISHIIDPGHFWAQHADAGTCNLLTQLIEMLNGTEGMVNNCASNPPRLLPLSEPPKMGKVYAVPFTDSVTWYYRARVVAINAGSTGNIQSVQVFFVDYGNTIQVNSRELREFPPVLVQKGILSIESQAYECVLSAIQPSILRNTTGTWSDESIKIFQQYVEGKVLYGKIYSVVHGVISLELIENSNDEISINQKMIDLGFAERAEESYLSKVIKSACFRLLVAGCVGQNPQGSRLTLRHTTLMPNIHGLPALMALIFAPQVELRTNPEKTKLTGALCGLGCDPETRVSLFPDHDMEITFDTEITIEDLTNINSLRYWMNFALHTMPDEELPDTGPQDIEKYQQKVKSFLFKLLGRKRKSQELQINTRSMCWGLIEPQDLVDPGSTPLDERSSFPLHWGVKLEVRAEPDEATKVQLEHIKELHAMASEIGPYRETSCGLCGIPLLSTLELRLHLESARHRDLEEDLLQQC